MRKLKLSLSNLMLLAACLILVVIATYERNRAFKIESTSIVTSNAGYKVIAEKEWAIVKRELQLQHAINELDLGTNSTASSNAISIANRRELANIRNLELKLKRDKVKLEDLRSELVQDMLNSSN